MKEKKIEDMPRSQQIRVKTTVMKPNLSRKLLSQISLSYDCKSIIYGTLLGDACLQQTKGSKNARLSIRHSSAQQEYFDWKVRSLQEIASPKSVQVSKSSGHSTKPSLLFQSRACEPLTQIMSVTHKGKKLRIQRRWLNHLTALSLAVWWCDDGSIISNGRKGVLCTDGFDESSVRLLANYLRIVWDINVRVGTIKRDRKYGNYSQSEYYRLWFSTGELQKWLRIIMPHIPVSSMVRKVMLIYKSSDFQQRWISEVRQALPQFASSSS